MTQSRLNQLRVYLAEAQAGDAEENKLYIEDLKLHIDMLEKQQPNDSYKVMTGFAYGD